ncbi:conserved hypothetical protein [Aspergillus terreus NIH2624]|uniref:Uncharacterized protein n=1 Tax=Aspergillus terreus (strain NIH 2624 / FGSC A1156) TaxID=341663 RepID=Q0CCW3_ASPTN|nr:uncharacterized protein ATEG_08471 [Aspergillus terreus NIH2624]EAU31644.1 conserved hypothetical protein [Aspergillus terreus NIH2624]
MDEDVLDVNERPETILSHQPKRQKTIHGGLPNPRHDWYTVGWICALHIEMAAARAMLDETHEPLSKHTDDSNTYVLGHIKEHNVVVACLPDGQYGTNNAAIVATNMLRTFPRIRICMMVGIGGGVPSRADLRLGDVVVGTRVMQCDLGKVIDDGHLLRTAVPRIPHQSLGTVVSALRSKHELSPSRVPTILQQKLGRQPAYSRPTMPDRLFHATYDHEPASGNQVMRSGTTRDNVARQLDIICFEMETAGLVDILPCLPIRGVCDYSDSHKSKEWQRYAAATAAAYARELLEEIPVTHTHTNKRCKDDLIDGPCDERRQHLLNSLRFERIDSRRVNIKAAHSKTCHWFISHPTYKDWLDRAALTQHRGFLWIRGKPGAGKSTIMKFAHERMRRRAQSKNSVTASFFFNARGEDLEKTVLGMYRSLLLQLLEGYPDLQAIFDDPELVPGRLSGCPPLNSLKDLFYNSVSQLGLREFTCFVDGLDECDEQQVIDMVQFFEDLTEQCSAKGIPFRICFSSRHYPYIDIRQGIRLTLEDQPGHAKDLETYAASRLRISDPLLAEELRSTLLEKAAGVFMWLVLVIDILNKEDRHGAMFLRKRLAKIPSDLSELFKDILRRDSEDIEALLLCILWILYAKRPLRPKEFYHAMWSGLSLVGLTDCQVPDITISDSSVGLNQFDRYVVHSSKGLAEVTKSKQPTVQFVHESVRDFLIKDKGLCELWPEIGLDYEGLGHERLTQCCCLYMNHPSVDASLRNLASVPSSDWTTRTLNKLPFLKYAGQYILDHANIAAKLLPQGDFLSAFQLSNWIKIRNAFEKFKVRRYTQDASLIYVLADNGYSELVRIRLKEDPQDCAPGERYRYPLFAALASGYKDTVAALLMLPSHIYDGMDLTEGLNNRKDFKAYENRTPLSWAAQDGRDTITKLIIQTGTDIDHRDGGGRSPLSRASENGHQTAVRLLVDKGAEVNTCDRDGWTPLSRASMNGHKEVVRLLIDGGAELNAGIRFGWTPLSWASQYGHEAVARLLMDKGADVNFRDKHGWTPLAWALEDGHEAVVRLLIEKGAEVNSADQYGRTPLSWASQYGHVEVVRFLIDKGADVNFRDKYGWTPLAWALEDGHEAVVRLLIEKGAEVNSADQYGRTPLSWASQYGHEAVARLLIESGADACDSDQMGGIRI